MIDFWAELVGSDDHWKWLGLAALLGIGELFVPGVFLIWVAAAAAVVGVTALLTGIGGAAQLYLFAILCVAMVYAGRRWYRDNPVESEDPMLNDRTARLVGQYAEVIEAITPTTGRARIGDSVWPARGPAMAVGSAARIVAVKEGTVQLEPAETAS